MQDTARHRCTAAYIPMCLCQYIVLLCPHSGNAGICSCCVSSPTLGRLLLGCEASPNVGIAVYKYVYFDQVLLNTITRSVACCLYLCRHRMALSRCIKKRVMFYSPHSLAKLLQLITLYTYLAGHQSITQSTTQLLHNTYMPCTLCMYIIQRMCMHRVLWLEQ